MCGLCDSELHETRDCPTVGVIQASERAAERPDLSDPDDVERWLQEES